MSGKVKGSHEGGRKNKNTSGRGTAIANSSGKKTAFKASKKALSDCAPI